MSFTCANCGSTKPPSYGYCTGCGVSAAAKEPVPGASTLPVRLPESQCMRSSRGARKRFCERGCPPRWPDPGYNQ